MFGCLNQTNMEATDIPMASYMYDATHVTLDFPTRQEGIVDVVYATVRTITSRHIILPYLTEVTR